MNHKQIYARMEFDDLELNPADILPVLVNLSEAGKIAYKDKYKFYKLSPRKKIQGSIDITRSGRVFLTAEGYEDDIVVDRSAINLLPFDTVEAEIVKEGKKKITADVTALIRHSDRVFSGVLLQKHRDWLIQPDNFKFRQPFRVQASPEFKAGYKVLFKIEDYPRNAHLPAAELKEILGMPGEHSTEMHAILSEFGLPEAFDPWVQAASDSISETISPSDLEGREDFRNVITFTIDPETAKDFDDAISYRKLKNGHTEIGVHIADVSHYVTPGTILDKEALNRATSVYLVDRVVPMLPFKLSDIICSLVPNADRLTFSAIFDVNEHLEVVNTRFAKTVIHSDKRFSYEEAQAILDAGEGLYYEELNHLNRFAKHLSAQRFNNGAMAFESTEYKFVLDAEFRPLSMQVKLRQDTNKLIEELMLLANRSVAEFAHGLKPRKPFVYRTHDEPSDLKLQELARFVSRFGYKISTENEKTVRRSINELSAAVEGKPEQDIIRNMLIRSMAKAVYTPNKPSHFGLAFHYYTHFTSPIRRYPDIIAHRLLFAYLQGETMEQACGWDAEKLDYACKQSSKMEIQASDAERASIKYKQAEWMEQQVGKQFKGVVSGLTDFGIFVEIKEYRCEGLVRLSSIPGDRFEYDSYLMAVTGSRTGRQFRMGQELDVIVTASNKIRRSIDLELVPEKSDYQPHGRKHRRFR